MRLSKYTNLIIINSISIIFVISGTQTLQNAEAQQPGISQMPEQIGPQSPQVSLSNFTASIPLASSLLEVLKSKINVSLADAMTDISNSMGPNATVLSGSVQTEGGFLVYRIVGLDDSNNINMILVDPANGSILSQQQLPAAVTQALSSIPEVGSQAGVPNVNIP